MYWNYPKTYTTFNQVMNDSTYRWATTTFVSQTTRYPYLTDRQYTTAGARALVVANGRNGKNLDGYAQQDVYSAVNTRVMTTNTINPSTNYFSK